MPPWHYFAGLVRVIAAHQPSCAAITALSSSPGALRDYFRMTLVATSYIGPDSPWENPFVESFNGRLRDERLNIEEFGSLTEAKVVIEDWRHEYNTYRPDSTLGGRCPSQYATITTTKNQQHA
jgi:putative transposase